MKNVMKKLAVASVLIAFVLTSCKKDKDNDESPKPASTSQDLALIFKPVAGAAAADFNSALTATSGQKYTLSTIRFYMSDIRLIKSDGSEYPLTGQYQLIDLSKSHFHLGKVPVGDYKGLKFSVGIDSVTNHMDPTVYPPTHPLAMQSPNMHWSWNSGYIFMMVEGSCDTTASNTDVLTLGQYSHSMFFHIGMDMLYQNVDLSNFPFSIVSGTDKYVNIQMDMNEFLSGVDLTTENQTHSMDNMMLAGKVTDNISSMFSIIP